jgi:nucleoside-diphosphate-sugar epimerase
MKKKVFITGANGFIGSGLCKYFSSHNFEVYGLVRKNSDLHFLNGINVQLVYGDLLKPEEIDFPSHIECFIHNASIVSDNADKKKCREGILDLTKNMINTLQKVSIGRFIYISSTLTLGFCRENISEDNPGLSCDFLPYVFYKKETESYLLEQFKEKKLNLVIIRPGDVYGPKDRTSCAKMLKAAERGVPLIVGKGDKKFPLCYIDNLCQAVYLAAVKPDILGQAFSVTNSNPITWRTFFEGLYRELGSRQRMYIPISLINLFALINQMILKIFPNYDPPMNLYRILRIKWSTSYNISKTVEKLGYDPDEDYHKQIKNIVAWYKEEKKQGRLKYY